MFKDYYKILEVSQNASEAELKKAFREQAIKWHPDRNIGVDTTSRMQNINEAYLILKDKDARARYDTEYSKYMAYVSVIITKEDSNPFHTENEQKSTVDYQVEDDVLKRWINNAKRQAVSLAQQSIRDFKGVSEAAGKGCLEGIKRAAIWVVVINVLFAIMRGCR
jgi:DnaJ-class molecular chaperone